MNRWQQVNELFQAALEHGPTERTVFLDDACAGDPWLRSEIESLLASHLSAGRFLETPAYDVAAELLVNDEDPSILGRRIGPYRLLREIGRGGMGAVFLAPRVHTGDQKHLATTLL